MQLWMKLKWNLQIAPYWNYLLMKQMSKIKILMVKIIVYGKIKVDETIGIENLEINSICDNFFLILEVNMHGEWKIASYGC